VTHHRSSTGIMHQVRSGRIASGGSGWGWSWDFGSKETGRRNGGTDTTRTSTPLEADEGLVGLPEGVGDGGRCNMSQHLESQHWQTGLQPRNTLCANLYNHGVALSNITELRIRIKNDKTINGLNI